MPEFRHQPNTTHLNVAAARNEPNPERLGKRGAEHLRVVPPEPERIPANVPKTDLPKRPGARNGG